MQTRDGSNVELAPRKVSDIDKKVGERVRVRREMLGLSQADLGRRCNISPQQIHKYETGESGMRASRIVQFSAALGVPITFFFDLVEVVSDFPDDLLALFANRTNAELVRLFDTIEDPTIKKGILAIVREYHRVESEEREERVATQRAQG